jgi:hypothetical protein
MPGHLVSLAGEMVHPRGRIAADLHFKNGHVRGDVSLPPEVTGTFCFAGRKLDLQPGSQFIEL